jgi:hypothetical protein
MPTGNVLYYGDNLDVLPRITSESVDVIYLDPPFNSNRSYSVLFKAHSGEDSQAQIEAFDDTWHWSQQTEAQYAALVAGGAPIKVAEAIEAMHGLLGPNDVLAYLVMMTARLVELHRVLKPTSSIYLHCDPTASHYPKLLMDAVFGPANFRNEIVWKRSSAHSDSGRWGRIHDVLLYYVKTSAAPFNVQRVERDPSCRDRGACLPKFIVVGRRQQARCCWAVPVRGARWCRGSPHLCHGGRHRDTSTFPRQDGALTTVSLGRHGNRGTHRRTHRPPGTGRRLVTCRQPGDHRRQGARAHHRRLLDPQAAKHGRRARSRTSSSKLEPSSALARSSATTLNIGVPSSPGR